MMYQYMFFSSTLSGASLGIAHLATVFNDTFPCRAKWYNLGLQLRVDVGTLDSIKAQYDDPGDRLREVMKTWLTTNKNPTWSAIVEALKTPTINNIRLAGYLQQKYCSSGCSSGQPPVNGECIHVLLQF